jgi:predicted transposase/invertase (TIGR01784 family)
MTSTPHDSLFKFTFTQVEHAAELLRHVLPPKLVRHIDFATLAVCPGSFVDEALKERHSDILFSAQLAGRPALFYFLTEHQSTVEALLGFRFLRYEVRIWEGWLKDNPNARLIPAIIPVLVHHSETGWTGEVVFEALLDVDAEVFEVIAPYVPRFRFILDDLSAESDEALRGRAMTALGRLALWCLRNARTPAEIVRGLGSWLDLVREVRRAPNGATALAAIFRYIFVVNERFGVEELMGLLAQAVDEEGKREMASVADQLIERGRREGERELLLKQLRARFGELPETAVARVNKADVAELDVWAERVLSAPTLAKVLT